MRAATTVLAAIPNLLNDLVTELHESKHTGRLDSCPEPICRDTRRVMVEYREWREENDEDYEWDDD